MKERSIEEKAALFDRIVKGLQRGVKYRLEKNCKYDSDYECGKAAELNASCEMDTILGEFEDVMPMDEAIEVLDLIFEDIEPDIYDPWKSNPLRQKKAA